MTSKLTYGLLVLVCIVTLLQKHFPAFIIYTTFVIYVVASAIVIIVDLRKEKYLRDKVNEIENSSGM